MTRQQASTPWTTNPAIQQSSNPESKQQFSCHLSCSPPSPHIGCWSLLRPFLIPTQPSPSLVWGGRGTNEVMTTTHHTQHLWLEHKRWSSCLYWRHVLMHISDSIHNTYTPQLQGWMRSVHGHLWGMVWYMYLLTFVLVTPTMTLVPDPHNNVYLVIHVVSYRWSDHTHNSYTCSDHTHNTCT